MIEPLGALSEQHSETTLVVRWVQRNLFSLKIGENMINKAIIPAAGFGTRFLPASKSQPKEMLPIVDKPTIQYVVEEAVDSGITDILMIIGKGKHAIEEHFYRNYELENELAANIHFI